MKDQLISFKTAKLAKEKGFVGLYPTTAYIPMYVEDDETFIGELGEQQGEDDFRDNFYLAVTQSLLQKWLREVMDFKLYIIKSDYCGNKGWSYALPKTGVFTTQRNKRNYNTYEEALEAGLQEALKLI